MSFHGIIYPKNYFHILVRYAKRRIWGQSFDQSFIKMVHQYYKWLTGERIASKFVVLAYLNLVHTMMVQCMVLLDKWTVQLGNVNKLMMFEFNLHTLIMTFRSVEFIVKSLPSAHCKFGPFSAFMSYTSSDFFLHGFFHRWKKYFNDNLKR